MEPQASPELIQMAVRAMDRALAVIAAQGSLPPMLTYRVGSDYQVETLAAKDSAEAAQVGRRRAQELANADACVLLYETYLRLDGQRADAVIAECQERTSEHAFVFARRYEPGTPGQPPRLLDKNILAFGTAKMILPASPPRVQTWVQIPSGAVIGTLATVVDRHATEYLALHEGQVVALRAELKVPQELAFVTRVEAADEWTQEHTEQSVCDLLEIRQFLDPHDSGAATCILAVTRDHLGSPPDFQRLKPLLVALQRVSARTGGAGMFVLGKASKGPGSLEEEAVSLIKGLEP
jgi:hypothetical protein